MKKIGIGVFTILLAMTVGCSNGVNNFGGIGNSKPIIKVNKAVITQSEFDKIYNKLIPAQQKGTPNPQMEFMSLIYKDKIVNDLVIKELINEEIAKKNIQLSNEELNKGIDDLAQKIGGKDKLYETLAKNKIDKKDFEEEITMNLKLKKLVDNLALGLQISDSDAKSFYNKNKATKFTNGEQVKAEHILISASPDEIKTKLQAGNSKLKDAQLDKQVQQEMDKIKLKAENILAEVKANPSKFEDLAKKYSEDQSSAQNGGDLGFFSKQQMVPAFSKVAFSLTPGKISDLVQTQFGYHIIKVTDRKKAGVAPFSQVKNEIKQYLANEKKMTVVQNLIESSKKSAKIVYVNPQYNPQNIEKEIKKLSKLQQMSIKKKAPAGK